MKHLGLSTILEVSREYRGDRGARLDLDDISHHCIGTGEGALDTMRKLSADMQAKRLEIDGDGNRVYRSISGTVDVFINEEEIVRQLGGKALRGKSGKSVALSGLITAHRRKEVK